MGRKFFEMKTYLLCLIICVSLAACEDEFCCIDPESDIIDTWVLFERGYSPGAGYIVEPVDQTPEQIMQIRGDGSFFSNIDGLEKYRYFVILPEQEWEVLALFEKKPPKDPDIDKLDHSYIIEIQENGTVNLFFRFCIEGCHLGLRRHGN